ncbi:MAG: hypothetical protein BA870_01085 [Desulfuromonadales bacterium C00003094]|nr:MAG: hypothetical protein BA870_01085 [Desulfuromonadales bacterium C00003094]
MKTTTRPQDPRTLRKLRRDLRTLALFTAVYCRNHHQGTKNKFTPKELPVAVPEFNRYSYCKECQDLLNYAIDRRLRCPLDPKPACRECPHNCYAPPQREAIRKVMAFAGPYLVKRGRFDLLGRLRFG